MIFWHLLSSFEPIAAPLNYLLMRLEPALKGFRTLGHLFILYLKFLSTIISVFVNFVTRALHPLFNLLSRILSPLTRLIRLVQASVLAMASGISSSARAVATGGAAIAKAAPVVANETGEGATKLRTALEWAKNLAPRLSKAMDRAAVVNKWANKDGELQRTLTVKPTPSPPRRRGSEAFSHETRSDTGALSHASTGEVKRDAYRELYLLQREALKAPTKEERAEKRRQAKELDAALNAALRPGAQQPWPPARSAGEPYARK